MITEWFVLAGALVATALAQVHFKLYFREKRNIHIIVSVLLFLSVPVLNYLALKALSIGVVYMSTAITHLLVVALSHHILNEELTRDHGAAMVFILSGVVLYAY